MSAERTNPFGGYRWALVDAGEELLSQLPVVDLVQGAVNGTVEEADAAHGRQLFAELDRRGDAAWWQAVDACSTFLTRNPVNGQDGPGAVAQLREAADAASAPWARLVCQVLAEHRLGGSAAAAPVWQAAPAAVRTEAGRRLFLTVCGSARSGDVFLTPVQVAALRYELFS
ncbi:hypothetical protein [Streptomyces sp. NPDC001404]|uniref:hypothetical protein n=1 Tax=Streptomyces sp. NPDC001404 TaxID=3364571 RepID=UPI003680C17A